MVFLLFYAMQASALTNMYTFLLVQIVWKEKHPAIVGCLYLHISRDDIFQSISRDKNIWNYFFFGTESYEIARPEWLLTGPIFTIRTTHGSLTILSYLAPKLS